MSLKEFNEGKYWTPILALIFWPCLGALVFGLPFASESDDHLQHLSAGMFILGGLVGGAIGFYATSDDSPLARILTLPGFILKWLGAILLFIGALPEVLLNIAVPARKARADRKKDTAANGNSTTGANNES